MDELVEISKIWINLEDLGDITYQIIPTFTNQCCQLIVPFPTVPPLRGELSSHGTTQSTGLVRGAVVMSRRKLHQHK